MVALEMTNQDHVMRDQALYLSVFAQNHKACYHFSSNSSCHHIQAQNAEHFVGNTFCITFDSFSLPCLISNLYFTVLDILL